MAIVGIDRERCVGCGRCDRACPMDVIYFDREKKTPQVKYPEDCQSCYLCLLACPGRCIQITAARAQRVPESGSRSWRKKSCMGDKDGENSHS